jgi:hypothetical protein
MANMKAQPLVLHESTDLGMYIIRFYNKLENR